MTKPRRRCHMPEQIVRELRDANAMLNAGGVRGGLDCFHSGSPLPPLQQSNPISVTQL